MERITFAGDAVRVIGVLDHKVRQGEEGDDVGDDHEVVEHIAQLPDEVVGHHRAKEDEDEREDGVDDDALLAEEVGDVDLAEEIPAEDGGEGKEEQAHRDEHVARGLTEDDAKRGLGEVGLAERGGRGGSTAFVEGTALSVEGGDDDERVEGQDDEGIDEHTNHGDNALIVRALDVRERVGVG